MFQVGICTSVANTPAGVDFIEENVQGYLKPEQPEFIPTQTTLPVPAANCFLPGALKCVGPVVDLPRLVRYADVAFQRAKQAGIEIIVFGSGGARKLPEGFPKTQAEEQFVTYLKEIGPLAGKYGVTIVIEPLNVAECNFINSIPEADALAQACDHPNVCILADFYHMLRDGQTPDDILRHPTRLRHVHVAEKADRTAPGVKGDDFRPFLRALKQVNYRGMIAIESKWGDLATEAGPAVAELRRQINSA